MHYYTYNVNSQKDTTILHTNKGVFLIIVVVIHTYLDTVSQFCSDICPDLAILFVDHVHHLVHLKNTPVLMDSVSHNLVSQSLGGSWNKGSPYYSFHDLLRDL
jgi:hypothetical protein